MAGDHFVRLFCIFIFDSLGDWISNFLCVCRSSFQSISKIHISKGNLAYGRIRCSADNMTNTDLQDPAFFSQANQIAPRILLLILGGRKIRKLSQYGLNAK